MAIMGFGNIFSAGADIKEFGKPSMGAVLGKPPQKVFQTLALMH